MGFWEGRVYAHLQLPRGDTEVVSEIYKHMRDHEAKFTIPSTEEQPCQWTFYMLSRYAHNI